jgi:hypothetical protein
MPLKLFKDTNFIISVLIIITTITTHLACKKDACGDCTTNPPPHQQPVDSFRWASIALPAEFSDVVGIYTENFLLGIESDVFAISKAGHVWRYNAGQKTWSLICFFPEDIGATPVTFSVFGMGYCIGSGHCWQFNPAMNQWIRKKDPPGASIGAPLVIGGKVYLRTSDSNHLFSYDPATDAYAQQNDPPDFGHNLDLLGYFVINDQGYYVGAYGGCFKYDASMDQWQRRAGFPGIDSVYRSYPGAGFSLNNRGYLLNPNGVAQHLWQYDASTDKWTITNNDYQGNGDHVKAVSLDSIAYVGLARNDEFDATGLQSYRSYK